MKTLLKLFVFASIIVLIAISCQKTFSDENSAYIHSNKEFNAAFIKEWYYGKFMKSAEWESSPVHRKKLPDWKNASYNKIGNIEIIEFPLFKGKTEMSIPSDNALTLAERKRLANASLSRVLFIKNAKGDISVREVDYIPDWQYLQNNKFDISNVSYNKAGDDFTGRMIIKKWDGTVLSIKLLTNGKMTRTAKITQAKVDTKTGSGNTSNLEDCTEITYCVFQQDCEWTVVGDSWEMVCGEFYNTGDCWIEITCTEVNCGSMTEQECLCALYNIGCDDPPPPPPSCDPTAVSPEEEEFNNYVLMQSGSQITEDAPTSTEGPNPISGTHIWTVAAGQIAGWQIKANTNYSYYHDKYYDANLNTFVHTYNLFNYQTVSSYFVGSNSYITSTWTQTSVLDQVLDNNTSNTRGTSIVHGTLRNQFGIPLNIPFCPKVLDVTTTIDPNTLIFNPR